MLPLSLSIITRNEEVNLRRCLESVAGLARETVVVDSGSTDGTRAVAEGFGARWYDEAWRGYRDQKNVALGLCTEEWVLALDADEEVSEAMRAEIVGFFQRGDEGRFAGMSFPRMVWFLGRWIRHGDWYPDRKLRLVRRVGARWGGSPEHDKLEISGEVLAGRGDLHHFSFPSMGRFVEKINVFADVYLERQLEAGKRWSLGGTLLRPLWRFFRGYVLKGGFMDGFPGFWIAWSVGFQTFVRHSRLYEHTHGGPPPRQGRVKV